MEIQFREFDQFDLWIWIEFETVPSRNETQYVEELFDSWFYIGKLGGFNAENLQIQDSGVEISYLDYDHDQADNALMAAMHNMGDWEYLGMWGRCWFDLGTSDIVAIDVLVNALQQLSKDFVPMKRVVIGGENPDWAIERSDDNNNGWYE